MPARGAEFNLVGSVTGRQEYNSNVNLDPRKRRTQDDFASKLIPRLRSNWRTERLAVGLSAEAVPTLYWEERERSDLDFSGRGHASYALSSRLSATAAARFTADELAARDVGTSGRSRSRRYLSGADATLSYLLSEAATASLTLGYDRTDYASGGSGGEDFQGGTVALGLTRDLDRWMPRTSAQVGVGGGVYDYESSRIRSAYGTLGLAHRISESWEIAGSAGARYSRSEFERSELRFVPPFFLVPVRVRDENSGWGGVGRLEVTRIGAMTRWTAAALHDINITFADGPTELTSLRFALDHRIRDEWSLGLSASWSWNRSDAEEFIARRRDETAYGFSPRLSWTPLREWTFSAGYNFLRLHDDVDRSDADRHTVFLEATYGISLFDLADGFSRGVGEFRPGRLIFPERLEP